MFNETSRTLWLGLAAACLLAAVPASATTMTIATGASSFNILSDTTGEITGPFPKPAVVITSLGAGWASVGGASWIGPNAIQGNRSNANFVGATDTYSTTFSLAGLNLSTISMALTLSADDYVTVLLNGNNIFSSTAAMWTSTFNVNVTDAADFLQTLNTLTFQVTNATGGPTGVIANAIITGDPIANPTTPEPSAALPLALALGAGVFVYRRKQSA